MPNMKTSMLKFQLSTQTWPTLRNNSLLYSAQFAWECEPPHTKSKQTNQKNEAPHTVTSYVEAVME